MELKNKIFAVSGAGSGLGKATMEYLNENGARVIALDIGFPQDTIDKGADSCRFYLTCDVTDSEGVRDAIKSGVSHFGSIHGAIACAGVAPAWKMHSSRKGSHSYKDFRNVLNVNLGGTFNLFNSCIPLLKKNTCSDHEEENGVLIATSSVAAFEGQIGQVAYAASKGGVSSMVLPMARELAKSGIRVNAIAPGIFQTPMVEGFPKEVQDSLAEQVPFPHRLGIPNEYAQLVQHIIENQYLNGTVIRLDGGVRMV